MPYVPTGTPRGRPKTFKDPVQSNFYFARHDADWLRGGMDRPLSACVREVVEHARLIEALRDPDVQERFWERVRKRRCWRYPPAETQGGYPVLSVEIGEAVYLVPAHRASWLMHRGTITPGKVVLQRCELKVCVRPDHLYLGEAE